MIWCCCRNWVRCTRIAAGMLWARSCPRMKIVHYQEPPALQRCLTFLQRNNTETVLNFAPMQNCLFWQSFAWQTVLHRPPEMPVQRTETDWRTAGCVQEDLKLCPCPNWYPCTGCYHLTCSWSFYCRDRVWVGWSRGQHAFFKQQ